MPRQISKKKLGEITKEDAKAFLEFHYPEIKDLTKQFHGGGGGARLVRMSVLHS